MGDLNTKLQTITLNVNALNTLIKKQRLLEYLKKKKKKSNYMEPKETYFKK